MVKIFLTALCISTSVAFAGPTPLASLNAFHDAVQRGDKAAALAELSPSVQIYEAGQVERSRSEYADHHLPADMAFSKGISRRVLKSDSLQHDKLVVIYQEVEITGRYQDKPVDLLGTETTVLTQQNGSWSIQHLHWSSRKAPRNPANPTAK